jgi:ketosteroid isomerase-like protein
LRGIRMRPDTRRSLFCNTCTHRNDARNRPFSFSSEPNEPFARTWHMNKVETVQLLYAAFGRGDVEGFLSHLHENVRWEEWSSNHAQLAEIPYLAPRVGKAAVAGFFAAAAGLELHELQVLNLLAGGDDVVAEVEIEFTVKATGKRLRDQELHLWSFAGDKVTRLRHYVDTAKHIAANRPG